MKTFWIIIGVVALAIVIVGTTTWVGSGHARVPLILVPVVAVNRALDPEEVATVGEFLGDDSQAYTHPVSEQFGKEELRKAFELLNSDSFQAPLTKYNCGDAVPRFRFQLVLYRTSSAYAGVRRVSWRYSPAIDHAGRGRCLSSGLSYLAQKAFAKIDPNPSAANYDRTTREPHCDCSKRDTKEEWVTYPGPDEMLW